jgi:hypothetical protein
VVSDIPGKDPKARHELDPEVDGLLAEHGIKDASPETLRRLADDLRLNADNFEGGRFLAERLAVCLMRRALRMAN